MDLFEDSENTWRQLTNNKPEKGNFLGQIL